MAQTTPMEQTGKRLVFEDSIEVQAPVQEVYRRFSDLTRFPDFMRNVNEVRPVGENRYHWVARLFGIKQEWDAEITEREQNRRLAWRSLNGAQNQGTVSFSDTSNGNTLVRMRLEYTPPAGKAGEVLDNLTKTTQREVREDLENFRRVVTGQMGVHPRDMEPEAAYHGNLEQMFGSLANVVVGCRRRQRRALRPRCPPATPEQSTQLGDRGPRGHAGAEDGRRARAHLALHHGADHAIPLG